MVFAVFPGLPLYPKAVSEGFHPLGEFCDIEALHTYFISNEMQMYIHRRWIMPANDSDFPSFHRFTLKEAEAVGIEDPRFPDYLFEAYAREEASGCILLSVLDLPLLQRMIEKYGIDCVLIYPDFDCDEEYEQRVRDTYPKSWADLFVGDWDNAIKTCMEFPIKERIAVKKDEVVVDHLYEMKYYAEHTKNDYKHIEKVKEKLANGELKENNAEGDLYACLDLGSSLVGGEKVIFNLGDMGNPDKADWLTRTKALLGQVGMTIRVLSEDDANREEGYVKCVDTLDELEEKVEKHVREVAKALRLSDDRPEYQKWLKMVKRFRRRRDPKEIEMKSAISKFQHMCYDKMHSVGCEECSFFQERTDGGACILGNKWKAFGEVVMAFEMFPHWISIGYDCESHDSSEE